ncbi:MAG TPA: DUF2306 domain-containing protein [Sphingomicrobium sp.]|nr:DUF2306 domain-containing protein [Sphingomicrobium sp.]
MARGLASLLANAWRGAIVLLTLQIAYVSVVKYLLDTSVAPGPIAANAFANPFLTIHVVAGVTALVVGPLQFVARIRQRASALHRASGLVYVAACALSAPAAFMLALGTVAGPIAGTGFAILAILLSAFTYLGLRAALERRFDHHREWMLRSYAMTATAITLRLMIPAAMMLRFDFVPAYQAIAWLSWIANLVAVEWYVRRSRGPAARGAVASAPLRFA